MAPAQPLTEGQFAALSKLLRLRDGGSAEAARLVLVDGLTITSAAERLGMTYRAAHMAVSRARAGIELARVVAEDD